MFRFCPDEDLCLSKSKGFEILSLRLFLGIPSEGRVKCSYIEKENIPTVWTVSMIFVITGVLIKPNKKGIT